MHAVAMSTALLHPPPAAERHPDEHELSSHVHVFAHVAKLLGHSPSTLPEAQPDPYASVRASLQLEVRHCMQLGVFDAGSALAHA
jgi:hypothetical protein